MVSQLNKAIRMDKMNKDLTDTLRIHLGSYLLIKSNFISKVKNDVDLNFRCKSLEENSLASTKIGLNKSKFR